MFPANDPLIEPMDLPPTMALRVFWSGRSARTSELLANVRSLSRKDRGAYDARIAALGACMAAAREACAAGDVSALVAAGVANAYALADLGAASDAPIVPPTFADLALLAQSEKAAFYPSGAGGGDVGVWLGAGPPSQDLLARARTSGMLCLDLGMDRAGVRTRKD
jgi:phosphomevalonate kinase